jgi:beta-lactam-binding protein with PASTA domain
MTLAFLLAAVTLASLTACKTTGTPGAAPSGTPSPSVTTAVALPTVTGTKLSVALTELSAAGFHNVEPTDATGRNRAIVNPQNWTVQSQDPAAGSKVDLRTRITLKVSKPSDGAGGGGTAAGVVPDVRCKDLQTAQDTLQAAGFRELGSVDGTGQGRVQIIDSNWLVIKQSAAPGSRPGTGTRIVLTVVKFGEPTGDSGCRS